jgi:hypothetical protein
MVKAMNRLTLYAIAFAVLFAASMPAVASCRQFLRYHHVKAVQYVQVAPVVLYQAGSDIQAQALADKVVRLARQELKTDQPQAQPLAAPQTGILSQRCAVCHTEGGDAFSFAGGLSDHHKVRWFEMLSDNKDVPADMAPIMAKIKADGSAADITDAVYRAASKPEEVTGDFQ